MPEQTLQDCRDIILRKPGWLSSSKDTGEKVRCLEALMELGGFDEVPFIFNCLRNDHSVIRNKAAEALLSFWKKAGTQHLKEIWFRSLPFDNQGLDYFRIDFDEDTYLTLVRIASISRSGFVREKAVNELGRLRRPENLLFIMPRLGDWVPQIRIAAITMLRTFLSPEYVRWFLDALALIDHQLEIQRVDLAAIREEVLQFVLAHASIEDINSLDDAKRLRYYRYFIKRCHFDESVAMRIFADPNPLVRLLVLNQSSALNLRFHQNMVRLALKDRSTLVKMKALSAVKQFLPDVEEDIRPLLLDKAHAIRDRARGFLKQTGIDFIEFYRSSIKTGTSVPGVIMGLCDVGNSDDLAIFQKHIYSKQARVSANCLNALDKIDRQWGIRYSLEMLGHKSGVVRRNVIRILATQPTRETLEKIREKFRVGDYRIKVTCMTIFNRIGGWSILPDLIDTLLDDDEEVRKLGWQLLKKLQLELTRLFMPAANEDLERARHSLRLVRAKYNNEMMSWQDSLVQKIAFFIR